MKQDELISSAISGANQSTLKAQITLLQHELDQIRHKVATFEAQLQSHLAHEIIAVQELSILYKKQKAEKKAKRLVQKRSGKHFKVPVGLKLQKNIVFKGTVDRIDFFNR